MAKETGNIKPNSRNGNNAFLAGGITAIIVVFVIFFVALINKHG